MKFHWKVSVFGAALTLTSALALADTIQIGSYQTGGPTLGNNNTAVAFVGTPSTTFALDPGGVWASAGPGSVWVSNNAGSGPTGSVTEPSGTYSYTTTFTTLAGNTYTGSISVLADDTTSVIFNGHTLVALNTAGPFPHCATYQPNCLTPLLVTLPTADFLTGLNTLEFDTFQDVANSGLDFYGSAIGTSGVIPEPSTLMLLGTGLFGAAGVLMRKRLA
ncbi:MAG TPA: PEP-CTERM sorting domain-containing protein [Edaphobacter sp.]